MSESADLELARRLRGPQGASIGNVFSFISPLYFRAKLAYARAFANPPRRCPAALVITPGLGLVPPDTPITLAELRNVASIPVDLADERYRDPLLRRAAWLDRRLGRLDRVILLGSIATERYMDPLLASFGRRLHFPLEFVGRGDMSRGGLMLRCVDTGHALSVVPAAGTVRHGRRPPRRGG